MIAVISSERDGHATLITERLRQRQARVLLLDLSDFPRESKLSIVFDNDRHASCRAHYGAALDQDLSECNVIWWRRPQPFGLHQEVQTPQDRQFAYTECQSAFSGLWLTLDAFWINHPTREEEAAHKVHQLKVAQEVGFAIPRTCVTNSPERAKRFVEENGNGGTVYKAFSGTEQAWRETRLLRPQEIAQIESVKYAPVIFQNYIAADVDLRVTVVGTRVFAAAIHSQETSYRVDFRMTMNEARVEAFDLPKPIVARLIEYVQRLGLVYGAIDMRLTPEGQYVYLEINPSGQWLFIEQRTGQPISECLADLMLAHDRQKTKQRQ